MSPTPFADSSVPGAPRLEHVFSIKLTFGGIQNIQNMPSGAGRGAVYIAEGTVSGPRLNGRVLPGSGGDWALFRPDDTVATDARYMIEADDGALILMQNRGFLWGRYPDTLKKIQNWMFRGGPEVPFTDFYLRASPSFEVEKGPHDWLTRHIFAGVGERRHDGNTISYYALL